MSFPLLPVMDNYVPTQSKLNTTVNFLKWASSNGTNNYVPTQSKLSSAINFLKCNSYARNTILVIAEVAFIVFAMKKCIDYLDKHLFSKISNNKDDQNRMKICAEFLLPTAIPLIAVNVFKVPMPWGYALSLSVATALGCTRLSSL
jgi:hypothetical protein